MSDNDVDIDIDEAHQKMNISETEEGAPKGSSSKWEDEYSSNNLTISPPNVQLYTEDNFPSLLTSSAQMVEESNISSASAEIFGQLQSLWSTSSSTTSTLSSSVAKGSDPGLWMELHNNSYHHHHQFDCDDQLWQHEPILLPCDLFGGDSCFNDWLNGSIYTNWDATI
ncbi:hypothetical protein FNV43_RR07686 [Rhamnella rubrinervis]|uniref:Uncharacterized protein n=1 Tax=Rhamnella rubrinervis TaxID=2594499 RepID=A0A8K0HF77_9ROSA|nr:hypothetical protein FNV43_RR07686 [Rhamnella rubrinervis]